MKIIPLTFSGIIILFCLIAIIISANPPRESGEFPRVLSTAEPYGPPEPIGTMLEGKELQPAADPQYMQPAKRIQ